VAVATRQVKHPLDQVLGLGPGDQDIRVHLKIQPPEFLMPRDVLRGLARGACGDQLGIAFKGLRRHVLFHVGMEVGAVAPEDVHQQQFCGKLRRRHLMREESLKPLAKCGAEVGHG
jgi:hypothetical protein